MILHYIEEKSVWKRGTDGGERRQLGVFIVMLRKINGINSFLIDTGVIWIARYESITNGSEVIVNGCTL
jgi:hypothetical protein